MKIGDYHLHTFETGRFALDGGAMFGVVPKKLWEKSIPADADNRIPLALRTLLLRSDKRTILIDTGIGDKFDEKYMQIYDITPPEVSIPEKLAGLGISRYDVTDIILTHLHFDHTGGTTFLAGGELKMTYPNAIHHLQEAHWKWSNSPAEKDRASFINENFSMIKTEGKLNLLTGECELYPGIDILVMHGHTPAMQLVKVSDGQNTLLYCADLIPTGAHVPVPWVMAYDNNPLITISEKKQLLPRAAEEQWILFFEHDPFREAATIINTEKGFKIDSDVVIG
ncbi:MAG: MBL fold metallo-hydrolase [Calditrichales bacterium]|nr:MAG: MBL fold metallo-hydrolase [Calditrichales bacterium]